MSETWDEKLSRVEMMASGSATWDLSDNDIAALKAVLLDRKAMQDNWANEVRVKQEQAAELVDLNDALVPALYRIDELQAKVAEQAATIERQADDVETWKRISRNLDGVVSEQRATIERLLRALQLCDLEISRNMSYALSNISGIIRPAIAGTTADRFANTCHERSPETKERCNRPLDHDGRHVGNRTGWFTQPTAKEPAALNPPQPEPCDYTSESMLQPKEKA